MASEKILSKEEITAALNERHTTEKQKLLSQGQVTIAGLDCNFRTGCEKGAGK